MKKNSPRIGMVCKTAFVLCAFVFTLAAVGDVLYLKDGSKIVGAVKRSGTHVTVETSFGTHRVLVGQVDHVEWGLPSGRTKAAAATVETGVIKKVADKKLVAGSQDVMRALERLIEIDFVDTPLPDVIGFFQNVTNVNFVLDYRSMPVESEPVTLKLKDVKLKVALKEILDPLDMDYDVRGNVIFISTKKKIQKYVVRVYDVRDLLVNFEDAESGSGNLTLGSQSGNDSNSSGNSSDSDNDNDDESGESIRSRVQSLAQLIVETVRPETWEVNAARVIGGPSDDDNGNDSDDFGGGDIGFR